MAKDKYLVYLDSEKGYLKNWPEFEEPKVVYELEDAKFYSTPNGAMEMAKRMVKYNPHVVTITITAEAIGMTEMIGMSAIEKSLEEARVTKLETFMSQLDKEREKAVALWEAQQKKK